MVKQVSNIYGIIDILYYPTKVFGMAPYTRKNDKGTGKRYVASPISLKHAIINGGVCIFMMTAAIFRIMVALTSSIISFIDYVDGGMYVLMQLASLGTMAVFLLRQKEFIISLKMIDKTDRIFKELGILVSYKLLHAILIVFFFIYPVYLFIIVAPLWEVVYEIQTNGISSFKSRCFLYQLINLAPVYIIRHTPLYFFLAFLTTGCQKLKLLNEYITKKESTNPANVEVIDCVLSTAEDVHSSIFQMIRGTSSAFALAMFLNLSITFLEVISLVVILKYSKNVETFQMLIGCTLFILEAFAVLIVSERIKTEANKTRRSLCELTLPYFNVELANKRKTIMLQLLHEKVQLNAGGFYSLDMAVLTSHMGTIITLLMFLLKMRDDLVG